MKENRKFKGEDNAVSNIIKVILIVAILVAIAVTVYVFVSGRLSSGPTKSAIVTIVQTHNYISVQKVTASNPINCSSASIQIVCINTNGDNQGNVCQFVDINNDGVVSTGDTVSINIAALTGGSPYTITLIFNDNAIGVAKFTPTEKII